MNENATNNDLLGFDLPNRSESSIIKVIGVGGGGSNAVNHMYQEGIQGVDFVVCNTDNQALALSPVPIKIQLGQNLTEGRGAGSLPKVGEQAAIESLDEVRKHLENGTKMVFITAGMGGGTGTGAAPVIAKLAKDLGILTVGIVTMPFSFEGIKRKSYAKEGIENLKKYVDTLLVISNDRLREMYGNLTLRMAFGKADNILTIAAKGIAEIITVPGYVNVDFEDVKTVMTNGGSAIMGAAITEGENRALRAAQEVLNSPLLDDSDIRGAKQILLYISFGEEDLQLDEMTEITDYVQEAAGMTANMIWGTGHDPALGKAICVTLIATGFNENEEISSSTETLSLPVSNNQQELTKSLEEARFSPVNEVEMTIENKEQLAQEPVFEIRDIHESDDLEELSPLSPDLNEPTENKPVTFDLLNDEAPEDLTRFPSTSDPGKLDIYSVIKNQQEAEESRKPATMPPPAGAQNRKESLQRITQNLRRPSDINFLEKQPAFIRRNVQLQPQASSKDQHVSNLSVAGTQDGFQLRENNSFLHDSVD